MKIRLFEVQVPEFFQRTCDNRHGFLGLFGGLGYALQSGDFLSVSFGKKELFFTA